MVSEEVGKVFVLGFHKTGTSTMAKVLDILGYKVTSPTQSILCKMEKNLLLYR